MDRAALLNMVDVTKRYHHNTVVDRFRLSAGRGELIALHGPNGSGKSTIIKMICGIVRPTAGTIVVNGWSITKNRKRYAQEISYMPDHFHFQQPLTVEEFLMYYGSLRQVSKSQVMDAIDRVGLTEHLRKYTAALSKGMRQRLLLAQSLFSNASLLLMDEPTNGLDSEWLGRFKQLLHELKAENKTVIFTTHLDSFAQEVSDRVVRI